ncbi:hypothetical protein ES703_113270 [subsurface metagenome]
MIALGGNAIKQPDLLGLLLRVEGADRLVGVNEVGVIPVHEDLGHHRHDLPAVLSQEVAEALLHHVAYLALRHRAEDDQGLRWHNVLSLLLLNRQVPHLGAVAVSYDDLVTLPGYLRNLPAGHGDVPHLLLKGAPLIGLLDGVAAEGDHDAFIHIAVSTSEGEENRFLHYKNLCNYLFFLVLEKTISVKIPFLFEFSGFSPYKHPFMVGPQPRPEENGRWVNVEDPVCDPSKVFIELPRVRHVLQDMAADDGSEALRCEGEGSRGRLDEHEAGYVLLHDVDVQVPEGCLLAAVVQQGLPDLGSVGPRHLSRMHPLSHLHEVLDVNPE